MINSATEEEEEEYILANSDTPTNVRRRRLWAIPRPSLGISPSARWGHCSVLLHHHNINSFHPTLMIFGGFDGSNMLNDIHLFDSVTNTWSQPSKTFGTIPSARSGHSTTLLTKEKGKILLIGGGNGVHYLADLVLLEVVSEEDEEWKKESQLLGNNSGIKCMNMFRWSRPKVSSRVRVYISDDDIILTEEQFQKLQEEINNSKNNPSEISEDDQNPLVSSKVVEQYIKANQSGTTEDLIGFGNPSHHEQLDSLNFTMKEIYPAPRSRHTAVATEDGSKVIVFGGGGKNRIFDDVWVFHVQEMEWSQPQDSTNKPCPRWGHSACIHSGKMFVYGGVFKSSMLNDLYSLDLNTFVWTKIELPTSDPIPSPRAAHTANLVLGRYLLILWGGDDMKYLDDIYIFDLKTNSGKRISFKSPKARCAHTSCLVDDNYLFVFGGGGSHQRFKELYLFDIKAALEKVGIYENFGYESDDEFEENFSTDFSDYLCLSQYLDKASQSFLEVRSDIKVEGNVNNLEERSENTPNVTGDPNIPSSATSVSSGKSSKTRRKRSSSKKKTLSNISNGSISNDMMAFSSKDIKEVTNWLVNLGLGRYANMFVQEEIDLECIPLLTDTDLFKLGISKFGPRKKILDAAKKITKSSESESANHHIHSRSTSNLSETLHLENNSHAIIQSMSSLNITCDGIKDTLKSLSSNISNLTLILSNPFYGFRHPTAVAISMHNNTNTSFSNGIPTNVPPQPSTPSTSTNSQPPLSPRQSNYSVPMFNQNIPPPPPNLSPVFISRPRNTSAVVTPIATSTSTPFKRSNPNSTSNSILIPTKEYPNSSAIKSDSNSSSFGGNMVEPQYSPISPPLTGIVPIPPPPTNVPILKKKRKRKPRKNGTFSQQSKDFENTNDESPELPSFSAGESWFDVTEKDLEQDSENEN